jgi:hypothetical protein
VVVVSVCFFWVGQKDAAAFLVACREMNVPAILERSRSGNGGHVWIFFNRAVPAPTARKLGCAILTRTMEFRHQLGLESYDRLFPNQDTMPNGGLGNLIALPLQKIPRAEGNSVFVNSEFRSVPNQWAFLASVERMSTLSRQSCEKLKTEEISLVSGSALWMTPV